jgi:hypothetical protein
MATGTVHAENVKKIHKITLTVTTDQYGQVVSKPNELASENFVSVYANDYRYFAVSSGWSNVRIYTTQNQPVWAANTSVQLTWVMYW